MKARIVFEFDTEGFSEAYSDVNNGACKENLVDLFRGMLHSLRDDHIYALADDTAPSPPDYLANVEHDIVVAKTILAGLKSIEEIEKEEK